MNVKKMIAVFLCLCLAVSQNIFAEHKTIILGGAKGWGEFSQKERITSGQGRFGYESLEIATNARQVLSETDMLVDFENKEFKDKTGNYKVQGNSLLHTGRAAMGHSSALSRGNGSGLSMLGNRDAIFGKQGGTGSFTIEFWLCPAASENGEVVFEWHSSRIIGTDILYQKIESTFLNSHIVWTFLNLFDGYTEDGGEVRLKTFNMLIPNRWTHHELSFDEETGLLEYRIDGKVEALKYITDGGREGRTIFHPVLGAVAPLNICPAYTGCIDDFRISHTVEDSSDPRNLNYERYNISGGRFVTKPLAVSPASVLENIFALDTVPAQTEIRYYVRSGDNCFNWTDSEPEWIRVKSGQKITGVQGRYFQAAAELFPDGGGNLSPSVTEIKLVYLERPLPVPPFKVRAKAGDSSVELTWNYSVDENAGGYYIYYGNRPGEYLGSDADQGPSPVRVDNINSFKLTGLKNGAVYYFAVSTYSGIDGHISGNLSDETYARPGR